jgi:tetratricopeptide (TPR) repeat protein
VNPLFAQNGSEVETRPVGVIQPPHESAVLALNAIAEKRLADAENHIGALPESLGIDRAWALLLRGLVTIERADFAKARPLLWEAACLALIAGLGSDGVLDADASRVVARFLRHLGWLYRRQDRPDEASQTHLAAHRLCQRHGSFEELWETAVELGLDADVARRFDDAQRWHRAAVEAGEKASDAPDRRLAIAWTNLSASCTESERHDEAVLAAGAARDCWRRHDVGAVTAAQADLKLGTALLRQGESLHEHGDKLARPVLEEADERLGGARDALLAFGPDHSTEARLCREQQDFTRRLLASLAVV